MANVANGILSANSGHFIALSLLFLPVTLAATAALQSLFSCVPPSDYLSAIVTLLPIKTLLTSPQILFSIKTLIFIPAYIFFVIPITAMITYSANQAAYNKPLAFSSTVKSLSHSYIPILSTTLAGFIKLALIFIVFTLSATAITEIVEVLELRFDLSVLLIFMSYALAITTVFFVVIWGTGPAIAVVESKLGFETLKLSANRLTEFRFDSFSIVAFEGIVTIEGMILNSVAFPKMGSVMVWDWFLQVVPFCLFVSMMFCQYVVANTALYVQSKVASGGGGIFEKAAELEVSGEYVQAGGNGGFGYVMVFFALVGFVLVYFKL